MGIAARQGSRQTMLDRVHTSEGVITKAIANRRVRRPHNTLRLLIDRAIDLQIIDKILVSVAL